MRRNIWLLPLIVVILILAVPIIGFVYENELAFTADNLVLIQSKTIPH